MNQELSPKVLAAVIGAVVVALLAIGYELFATHPAAHTNSPAYLPANRRMWHPRGPDNPMIPPPGQTMPGSANQPGYARPMQPGGSAQGYGR